MGSLKTEEDIRSLGKPIIQFTEEVEDEIKQIKNFLFKKVYTHHRVASVTLQGKTVIKKLFKLYASNISLLPVKWRNLIDINDEKSRMSLIADYIAGMTDRYAIKQYHAFYNLNFAEIDL